MVVNVVKSVIYSAAAIAGLMVFPHKPENLFLIVFLFFTPVALGSWYMVISVFFGRRISAGLNAAI